MAVQKGQLIISCKSGGSTDSGRLLTLEGNRLHGYAEDKADEGPTQPGNIFWASNGELIVCEKRAESSRLMLLDRSGSWKVLLWVKDGPISGVALSPDGRFIFVNLPSTGTLLELKRKE